MTLGAALAFAGPGAGVDDALGEDVVVATVDAVAQAPNSEKASAT
jgi:hypothetical protein